MSENKRTILMPQYLKNFKCIGSACEDTCCIGWKVEIDSETFKKYQLFTNEEFKPLIKTHLTPNNNSTGSRNYAYMKLNEEGKCPFLSKGLLCGIQLKKGEDYLSEVCASYPRVANIVNGAFECSAAMSCPEAVRIALFNAEPMEFDEEEVNSKIQNIINIVNTNNVSPELSSLKYLWELRIFTITLLQNRSYSIEDRLIILGLFFQKLQKYVDNKMVDEIPKLITTYSDHIEKRSFVESLSSIQTNYLIQMELLKALTTVRYSMGVANKRYSECTSEFLNGLKYTDESNMEEVIEKYNEAFHEYYKPFMDKYEHVMENYLVNYVFENLFPFSKATSLFNAYMIIVIQYSTIKMHLIGLSTYHKGLTPEILIKLIQSFTKTVEHHTGYLLHIAELMQKNGYNSMAYMTILIKN